MSYGYEITKYSEAEKLTKGYMVDMINCERVSRIRAEIQVAEMESALAAIKAELLNFKIAKIRQDHNAQEESKK